MVRNLTTLEKVFAVLFLLTAAVFAARGIVALHDGEYWQSARGTPPVRHVGTSAQLFAWSQIATGLMLFGSFLSWRGKTGRMGWIPAIIAGIISALCYGAALLV